MIVKLGDRRYRVDLGHLIFLTALTGFCIWYLFDARAVSTSVQNLVLIQPATILALILFCAILREIVTAADGRDDKSTRRQIAEEEDGNAFNPDWSREDLPIAGFIGIVTAYVASMFFVPFDVTTFLFLVASLLLQGERRPLVLFAMPLIFTGVVVYVFKSMLSIPFPTLLG